MYVPFHDLFACVYKRYLPQIRKGCVFQSVCSIFFKGFEKLNFLMWPSIGGDMSFAPTVSEETPLRVTCEWPYGPLNDDCEIMTILLTCVAWYEQSEWPIKVTMVFIISLYMHDIRLLRFSHDM